MSTVSVRQAGVAPSRRAVLRTGAGLAAAWATGARGQSGTGWPTRPVKIVSPYPAGGSNDAAARVLAMRLGEIWNQRVFVENKPGANNRIATQELARAAPDGYHLMLAAAPHGANPGLYDHKLPYDTLRDFAPIMHATVLPVGFRVAADSPFRTLRALADAARAQPGRLFAGSPGNASGPHLVIELFNWKTGAKLQHLPMKGDAPLEAGGTFVAGGTPEQFGAFIAAEVEKWSQVAKATGMKPD